MASLDLARNTFGMTWSSNGLTHEGDHLISVRILSARGGYLEPASDPGLGWGPVLIVRLSLVLRHLLNFVQQDQPSGNSPRITPFCRGDTCVAPAAR